MNVSVDVSSPVPAYEQIRSQVAALVASSALPAGTRLPPIRQLASDLELAPGTVAKAYALLEQAGIAKTGRRRGTVINDLSTLGRRERRAEVERAATTFAQAMRLLDVDVDTARAAVDAALRA